VRKRLRELDMDQVIRMKILFLELLGTLRRVRSSVPAVKSLGVLLLSGLVASAAAASPLSARWTTYSISQTGTSVDLPSSIFTEKGKKPEGYGDRFETADGRADLTIQSVPNNANITPAEFLAHKHPPPHIQYKRITNRFFAVSSYKGDKVWYDRCNFSHRFIHCVLINYPASEERDWDALVTRVSLSLRGH
jgi:hypothetical protein